MNHESMHALKSRQKESHIQNYCLNLKLQRSSLPRRRKSTDVNCAHREHGSVSSFNVKLKCIYPKLCVAKKKEEVFGT